MTNSPSLSELRRTVQKERHREIGNWLARRIARPTAIYGTWLAIRLGLTAHQVTVLAILAGVAGSLGIGTGTQQGFVAGVLSLHLWFWLDHVDGQVARWRHSSSLDGVYFDYLMHHAMNFLWGFALGYGLASRSGDPAWAAAGAALALGWSLLSLGNDCRYKALFQRLKHEHQSFRVDGGSGGRPQPPAPWPRRGLGMITWPAYKICEPHVVLIGLTAMAVIAIIAPAWWEILWKNVVRLMAVMAPALAVARSARIIARGSVSAEFDAWFRPWDDSGLRASPPTLSSTREETP